MELRLYTLGLLTISKAGIFELVEKTFISIEL